MQHAWSNPPVAIRWEDLLANFEACIQKFTGWNNFRGGTPGNEIMKSEEKLDQLHRGTIMADSKLEEGALLTELHKLLGEEEIYWKQHSKLHRLKDSNRNTPIFHSKASARRRTNAITRLQDEQGRWCEDDQDIQEIII